MLENGGGECGEGRERAGETVWERMKGRRKVGKNWAGREGERAYERVTGSRVVGKSSAGRGGG